MLELPQRCNKYVDMCNTLVYHDTDREINVVQWRVKREVFMLTMTEQLTMEHLPARRPKGVLKRKHYCYVHFHRNHFCLSGMHNRFFIRNRIILSTNQAQICA